MDPLASSPTQTCYDVLAPAYDALTEGYCHDLWLARIEELALAHGLVGRRVLDIACGTGNSFLPLLRRGYSVEASDVSAAMVAIARRKADGMADVRQEDMRHLSRRGPFDLVLCLDDAINYLIDAEDLRATMRSVAANLADGGLFIFDTNTLHTYRTAFASDWAHESGDRVIVWRGRADESAVAGSWCSATVEVFTRRAVDDLWQRQTSVHRQRHWQIADVVAALDAAGLRLVACKGQRRGAQVHDDATAPDNHKLLYVARAPSFPYRSKEAAMIVGP